MKKRRLYLSVFVVLALVLSTWVFLAARRQAVDQEARRLKAFDAAQRRQDPGLPQNRDPRAIPPPPRDPLQDVQRSLKTVQEINQINKMNEDLRRRQENTAPKK